jgi:hypothetical protein
MNDEWIEIASGVELARTLDLTNVGEPSLERLLLLPDSSRYLRVEADDRTSAPGSFDVRVPGTRFYFNFTACKELRGDVIVAATAFLITHSLPAAAAATMLRKLNDNLKRLTPEEVEMVRAIVRACPGNPYDTAVEVSLVRERFRGDPAAVDAILDALQDKSVLRGRRGERLQLIY